MLVEILFSGFTNAVYGICEAGIYHCSVVTSSSDDSSGAFQTILQPMMAIKMLMSGLMILKKQKGR